MTVVAVPRRTALFCKGCGKQIKGNNFVIIHGKTYCNKFCIPDST